MNSKLFCFNAKKLKTFFFYSVRNCRTRHNYICNTVRNNSVLIKKNYYGKSTEKDLAESVVKAIEEDAITESEMETTEGGHNGNCGCVPKPDHMKQDSGL